MPTRRQQRLNEMLLEELSLLVPGQLDDPRLVGVRVTRVQTTQDMSVAKVYFTRLEAELSVSEVIAALQHAAGPLSVELGALGLRRMPKLVFALDKEFESGERVLWLLDHLEAPDRPAGGGEDDTPAGDSDDADAAPGRQDG